MDEAKSARTTRSTREASRRLNGSLLNGHQHHRSVRDEELSQLEDEIKKAYALKALHAQMAEQEANQMAESIQTRLESEVARLRADTEAAELDRSERSERERRTSELRAILGEQVERKREERAILQEEERRERQVLIEVDRIREERESAAKARSKEELAGLLLMEGLIQREIREINKKKLEELEELERANNEKYAEEVDRRVGRLRKMRLEARERRELAIARVSKLLVEMDNERRERRRLLLEICVEEVKFDAEVEAREAAQRRRQQMRDLAKELEEQIRLEEECRARFLEREKEFADAVLARVMESERMDRLTAEMRRRRKLEYREELEHLMGERERTRLAELDRLRVALEEERLREEEAREEARKARMLLLERHVDNVADFMSRTSLYQEERGVVEESLRASKRMERNL